MHDEKLTFSEKPTPEPDFYEILRPDGLRMTCLLPANYCLSLNSGSGMNRNVSVRRIPTVTCGASRSFLSLSFPHDALFIFLQPPLPPPFLRCASALVLRISSIGSGIGIAASKNILCAVFRPPDLAPSPVPRIACTQKAAGPDRV